MTSNLSRRQLLARAAGVTAATGLGALGYTLFGLYDLHHGRNGQLTWGDALFVAPALYRASIVAAYGDVLAGKAGKTH